MTNRRQGTQPHIPRLTYRNAPSALSISDHSIRTVGTQSSNASESTCPTSPPTSSFHGSPLSCRFSEDVLSPLSLDGASDPRPSSTFLSPQTAREPKKKSSSSILKFFSVKEPSTQAFEAYQEQMKKRGTTQTGRANAVGLPGVSSARLPPTVPKVNSKWDGVPQAAKEKLKEKDNPARLSFASSAGRPLYTSQSTGSSRTTATASSTSSTRSDLRTNGKLRLDNSSGNLADLYGWEVPSAGTSSGSFTRGSPFVSGGSLSPAPTLQRERTSYFPHSPLALPTAYDSSAETPPPLDPSCSQPSPLFLPSLATPPTPNDSVHPILWAPASSGLCHGVATKDSILVNKEPAILSSSGTNVLGPPVSAIRRPGSAPFAAGEATEVILPSTPPSRPLLQQPSSIFKRPVETPREEEWPLPVLPQHADKITSSSAPTTATKPKRMNMKSIFIKDT
ncbi:MAG: hypothetical protein Q9178_007594 [Gyalolechia marmorata]